MFAQGAYLVDDQIDASFAVEVSVSAVASATEFATHGATTGSLHGGDEHDFVVDVAFGRWDGC